ncbi:MAG: hypothetical protein HeimC3_24860 [Candidatus Heimdallarchaeota archaeon LC_3]|nr:MAG: hypothetical protein HeimC3_24860 [Candidatus Heimdallarchaeota archaeon LC_3]
MDNNNQSSFNFQILEKEMIKNIVEGYFECKSFFQAHHDNTNIESHKEKEKFLKRISREFFEKFQNHPYCVKDDYGREVLEKNNRVLLKFRSGGFFFPRTFSHFMDRLQDINITPVREIDLTDLDEYMKGFSDLDSLDDFLSGFFIVIKSLTIPLREREVEVLKILTKPEFLLKDAEGKPRIHSPEIEEIVAALGYSKKNLLRVKRSENLMYNFRVCWTNMIAMNPAKFGFYYAQFEYTPEMEGVEKIKPYLVWDLPLKDRRIAIACVPFGNVNELLNPFDYTQLTDWLWNANFQDYSHDKHDSQHGWSEFEIPDILSNYYRTGNFVHWDLERSYKDEFNENEVEIIKNLTKTNTLSLRSLDLLSKNLSSGGIRHILNQFVENGVYQQYPNVAFIGLKDIIFVTIKCEDKDYFQNIVHNLLSYPVAHVFSNEKQNLIIGYIHVPGVLVNKITDKFNLLSLLLKDKISIEYELLPNTKKISKFIELSKINFTVKNGIAYTIDEN